MSIYRALINWMILNVVTDDRHTDLDDLERVDRVLDILLGALLSTAPHLPASSQ